jgi:hypothetical protein
LTEVTGDAVQHWLLGTGDRNPLFDPWSVHRRVPPAIILGFNRLATGFFGGLPGVHGVRWQ